MTAVYPGSFDPMTNGHLDIIKRASAIFDRLYVVVASNSNKKNVFSANERVEFLKRCTKDIENVVVVSYDGLVAQFVKEVDAKVIIKGLRNNADFEYEFQMANVNNHLNNDAETLFMVTNLKNIYVSSSVVRELAIHGGSITGMVPACIEQDIIKKFN
ncbi:MAG: pantetheine-phosphate adenylyltransferase [Clostridia bacterium]|nr:pantetheine-phosphate adenylyltransferase [Clostridia bacterium]MBQ9997932.1 pantetheine-phosphate adenylyltransferase [Clostridia bacterium]